MTRSRRRRSSGRTPTAVVSATHCCGTTRPSGPTASRATCTHACSSTKPRRAKRPVRGQAAKWSPNTSTRPRQPGKPSPPQRARAIGKGSRRRRRRARCIRSGVSSAAGCAGIALSQDPACGPDWDRNMARASGVKAGNIVCSRKEV